MEFKGTKGSWKGMIMVFKENIEAINIYTKYSSAGSARIASMTTPDSYIGQMSKMSNEECKANAKLIAAAPDLLKALQVLIDPFTGLVVDFVAHEIGKENAFAIEQAIEKALK